MYKKREQQQPVPEPEKPITIGSTQFEEEDNEDVDVDDVNDGLKNIEEGDESVDDDDDSDLGEAGEADEEEEHLKKVSFVVNPTKRSHSRYKRLNVITKKLQELHKITKDEYLLIHVNVLGKKNSKTSKKRFACTKKMSKLLKVKPFMEKLVDLFEKRD